MRFTGQGDFKYGSIQFDADEIIEELGYLQRVQMPFVMSWSLNKLGPKLRELHAKDMSRDFDRPVPFTLNSPRYTRSTKQKLEIQFWISEDGKAQDPAAYLFPQVRENGRNRKQVYVTRFTKAARRYGIVEASEYLLPLRGSKGARLNQYGNISPGQYTQVLYSIGAFTDFINRQAGKRKREPKKEYFAVRSGRGNTRLAPGIYRRRGDTINLLFATLPEVPYVTPKYDFYGNTEDWATDYFPQYVEQKLGEIMG